MFAEGLGNIVPTTPWTIAFVQAQLLFGELRSEDAHLLLILVGIIVLGSIYILIRLRLSHIIIGSLVGAIAGFLFEVLIGSLLSFFHPIILSILWNLAVAPFFIGLFSLLGLYIGLTRYHKQVPPVNSTTLNI